MNRTARYFLTALLLLSVTGCSGRESEIPDPDSGRNDNEQNGGETPDNGDDGDEPNDDARVVYVASAAEVKALGTVDGGTRIVWRNGRYANVAVELKSAGTAEAPVVFCAETAGKAVFTGTSTLTVSGSDVVVDGFWWRDPQPAGGKSPVTFAKGSARCTLRNCAITGDTTDEDAANDTKWVSLYGTGHTVEHCTFLDKRNIGTLLVVWMEKDVVPAHRIAYNDFSRPVTLWGDDGKAINGQETIRIGTSDYSMQRADCTVEGNRFRHCHGEQAEIISNKSCGNVYRGNVFVESQGTLTLRHGNDCTVEDNWFFGNGMDGTGGIRVIGERHTVERNWLEGLWGTGYRTAICLVRGQENAELNGYWQVQDAVVRDNTIVDCRYGFNVNYGSASGNQTLPVITTRIERNTVSMSDAASYAVSVVTNPKPDIEWTDNTIFGGRQEGVSLPAAAENPVSAELRASKRAEAAAIEDAAGCDWM